MMAMAEYIEREATKKEFSVNFGGVSHAVIANRLLDSIPAADVAPVVHGRWKLLDSGNGVCSICHCITVHVWDFDSSLNYCPHCGTKMDGKG
jgi:hypothetical protein